MDRIELELYADRLARHADRVADRLVEARTRRSWDGLERDARARLSDSDCALLEELGVLRPRAAGAAEPVPLERHRHELEAVRRLQAYVEERLQALRGTRPEAR